MNAHQILEIFIKREFNKIQAGGLNFVKLHSIFIKPEFEKNILPAEVKYSKYYLI
jgi:hypothetical protein